MKLAGLKAFRPGGTLLVVSADLTLCQTVGGIAPGLAQAVADWHRVASQLEEVYAALSTGHARHAHAFDPRQCQPLAEGGRWVAFAECGAIRLVVAPGECVAVSLEDLPAEVREWLEGEMAAGRFKWCFPPRSG
ncbi:MAG: hypothetical protein PHI64_03250 [Zoogloea sp.]|uniref:hypothetical protein n=1 Tax=Zoogloea sp. TaxID=49181 RepID=UPI00262178BB|nr:hypothetical protein [Zoogloea sp.]MDD2987954.1 hypothetical protein [Zoogloea sp.]